MAGLAAERRAARERALGLLYEAEAKAVDGAAVLAELPVPPDDLTTELVLAVDEHRARIDELLERFAEGWSLGRMPALDRAALRMGSAELLARADVPTAVVLSETVDLASRFSTDGSGRFVNGLLARMAQELRPDAPVPHEPVDLRPQERQQRSTGSRAEPVVDGVIIDLDGVIRHWDPQHLPAAEVALGLPAGTLAAVAFEEDRLARVMDGRLPFAAWCAEIGATVAAAHGVDPAAAGDVLATSGWEVDLSVIDLVAAVRERVPVALLSNASTQLAADLDRSGIAGAFDAVVGSADIGHAKPAHAAFAAAADAIGVPLERCLFVDDTVGHVEAARAYGVRAEVFTDRDALRELFDELGLLP